MVWATWTAAEKEDSNEDDEEKPRKAEQVRMGYCSGWGGVCKRLHVKRSMAFYELHKNWFVEQQQLLLTRHGGHLQ